MALLGLENLSNFLKDSFVYLNFVFGLFVDLLDHFLYIGLSLCVC